MWIDKLCKTVSKTGATKTYIKITLKYLALEKKLETIFLFCSEINHAENICMIL